MAIERTASSDAEVRLAGASLTKLGNEIANATAMITVTGLPKGSARVLVDAQNRGVLSIAGAPKGFYVLRNESGQTIANVQIPADGRRTMFLDHLTAAPQSLTLTSR